MNGEESPPKLAHHRWTGEGGLVAMECSAILIRMPYAKAWGDEKRDILIDEYDR